LGTNCSSFPIIKNIPLPAPIQDADVLITLNSRFMQDLVSSLFSHPIEFPLSGDPSDKMSDHFVVINKLKNLALQDSNRIIAGVSADLWFRVKKIKAKFAVPDLELVLVPMIVKKDTSFYLNFPSQLKFLQIKNVPTNISQCLANYVTDKGYLNKDSLDFTKFLALKIKNPLDTTANIAPKIGQATIVSDGKGYTISLKTD